jgi:hypothetical protein
MDARLFPGTLLHIPVPFRAVLLTTCLLIDPPDGPQGEPSPSEAIDLDLWDDAATYMNPPSCPASAARMNVKSPDARAAQGMQLANSVDLFACACAGGAMTCRLSRNYHMYYNSNMISFYHHLVCAMVGYPVCKALQSAIETTTDHYQVVMNYPSNSIGFIARP